MKWLENLINRTCEKLIFNKLEDFSRNTEDTNKAILEQIYNFIENRIKVSEQYLLEKIEIVSNSISRFDDNLNHIKIDVERDHENQKEFKNRMMGFMEGNKRDIHKILDQKIEVMEGSISNTVNSLRGYVSEKTSSIGNGNKGNDVQLLKRLAAMEEVKDAIEHRRKTQEIIDRRTQLQNQMMSLAQTDRNYEKVRSEIDILNWVLAQEE